MSSIPCGNHIRQMLDGVPTDYCDSVFADVAREVDQRGVFKPMRCLGGEMLIALDGSEHFCSRKISCPHCSTGRRNDGEAAARHHQSPGRSHMTARAFAPVTYENLNLLILFTLFEDGFLPSCMNFQGALSSFASVRGRVEIVLSLNFVKLPALYGFAPGYVFERFSRMNLRDGQLMALGAHEFAGVTYGYVMHHTDDGRIALTLMNNDHDASEPCCKFLSKSEASMWLRLGGILPRPSI